MQTQRRVPTRHHLANLRALGQSITVATLRPYGAHRLAETIGASSETIGVLTADAGCGRPVLATTHRGGPISHGCQLRHSKPADGIDDADPGAGPPSYGAGDVPSDGCR